MSRTYKAAGVDVDAGAALVEAIKPLARSTARSGVMGGIGGFGAFFVVHMTISEPFQVNPIGTLRGVPSLAT